ncbi:MAG: hypothetical protein ACP5JE_04745, partial [Thermoplasmata archaeon]
MAGIFEAGWIGDRRLLNYPNAFFNPLMFAAPDIKSLFEWCEFFAISDGIVNSVISKLSIYPVTKVVVEPENNELAKKIQEIYDNMMIESFLMRINTQYFTYGNVFVSVVPPTTRILTCRSCGKSSSFDAIKNIKLINFQFNGLCPVCNNYSYFDVHDLKIENPKNAKIILWNPKHITIDPSFMGYSNKYSYDISTNFIDKIGAFSFESTVSFGVADVNSENRAPGIENFLKNIPLVVLTALQKKQSIIFDNTNFLHLELPGMPGWYSPWGMPLILPALRDLYFYYIVRKAMELIIRERLVPFRAVFPQTSGTNPAEFLNLSQYQAQLQAAFKKWTMDPNFIEMFPYPLGYQIIGGEELSLPLDQYAAILENRIIAAMKAPRELIYGGLTWSGASVDLRMLENLILNLRQADLRLLNFIKDRILITYYNIPVEDAKKIKVSMTDLKMADDIQRQQLYYQMASEGMLSETTFLRELGKNFKAEQ